MDDTYLVIVLIWNLGTIIFSIFQCKSFSLPKRKGEREKGKGQRPTSSELLPSNSLCFPGHFNEQASALFSNVGGVLSAFL
jgi:hypothetical protein